MKKNDKIILFDGVCNLCNGLVQFILRNDKYGQFRFVSLQSEFGNEIISGFRMPSEKMDSFVLIDKNEIFFKSEAALKLFHLLGFPWSLILFFKIFPKPLRDWFYDFIAKNRYKVFGKKESCMIPKPEYANRFLG